MIRSDAEYRLACARLDVLERAGEPWVEGGEVADLADAVVDYEDVHFPVYSERVWCEECGEWHWD